MFFANPVSPTYTFNPNSTFLSPHSPHSPPQGGAYFTFSLVTSQLSVLVTVWAYNNYYIAANSNDTKLSATTTWSFAVAATTLWCVLFAYFMVFVCEPKHRRSFYTMRTGWRHTQGYFLDFETDSNRVLLFECNWIQWRSIENEVRKWTMEKWDGWERDKPEWFTPQVIATIPDDFIPPRALARLGGYKRDRRSSAARLSERSSNKT